MNRERKVFMYQLMEFIDKHYPVDESLRLSARAEAHESYKITEQLMQRRENEIAQKYESRMRDMRDAHLRDVMFLKDVIASLKAGHEKGEVHAAYMARKK